MEPFVLMFKVGKHCKMSFRYIGINLSQFEHGIGIDQASYVASINQIELSKQRSREKISGVTEIERTALHSVVGQLNWAASQTRPDIMFDTCMISTNINRCTVADLLLANKIVRKVKGTEQSIWFPNLGDVTSLSIVVYADASYANLQDGGSQGGHVVLLVNPDRLCCPLIWSSKRIKRVVKSTIAAETLSLVEGVEAGYLMAAILGELIWKKKKALPVQCFTDNHSLYKAVHSTGQIIDKRLRVDLAILREMVDRKELKVEWIEAGKQISDVLTKRGASPAMLSQVMISGKLDL